MQPQFRSIIIGKLLASIVSGFLLVGLPLYLLGLGMSIPEIGMIFGIASALYSIISFYLGSLSEHSGRLKFVLIAICIMAIAVLMFSSLPLFAISTAVILFTIAKILLNMSESVIWVISQIRIADLSKRSNLGGSFGSLLGSSSSGYGIGMLLGAFLLKLISFQAILFILLAFLAASFMFYRNSGDIRKKKQQGRIFSVSKILKTPYAYKLVLAFNTLLLFEIYIVDIFGLPLYEKEALGLSSAQAFLVLGLAWLFYGLFAGIAGSIVFISFGKILEFLDFNFIFFLRAVTEVISVFMIAYIIKVIRSTKAAAR